MARRKGIILAGGTGSRLFPLTYAVSKQLLPVYDKPMIYYPLATLIEAGLREIAIITTPHHRAAFREVLGDGRHLGLNITFIAQPRPEGLAQAYTLAEDFLDGAGSVLALGDNIFAGDGVRARLAQAVARADRGTVFTVSVPDPQNYGIVSFDHTGRALSIQEKPRLPKSNCAVTGLYVLDGDAPRRARTVRPSARGELEITDVLQSYLEAGLLDVENLDADSTWFDTGSPENLLDAALFVRDAAARGAGNLGCIEEVAFRAGLIDASQLLRLAARQASASYGRRLRRLATLSKAGHAALATPA